MAVADPGSVTRTGNAYVDSLIWGDSWDQSTGPITYEFWRVEGSYAWTGAEKIAFRSAMASWSAVAEVEFQDNAGHRTDLNFLLSDLEPGLYAYQSGPHGEDGDGLGEYDRSTFDDWFGQLRPGGFAYSTVVHELGHALGLAHPHDPSGISTIFPGVTEGEPWDTGSNGLNTWLATVMSYNNVGEWWAPGEEAAYGFVTGPMAFDIAAIQHIYGANMATAVGDDAYALPGGDRVGTAYGCIWDAGGIDRIAYSGALDAVIDLRPAPLAGAHAGGYLSGVAGVHGGFTIANGALIENAYGGSGDDLLTGNDAGNRLYGGRGSDLIEGGRGNDIVVGGAGADDLDGGSGFDVVSYHSSRSSVAVSLARGIGSRGDAAGDRLVSVEGLIGGDGSDTLTGGDAGNRLSGRSGADRLYGGGGSDSLAGDAGADRLYGGNGNDRLYGVEGADLLYGGDGADRLYAGADAGRLAGDAGDDMVYGSGLADRIAGNAGDDRLHGEDGGDLVHGGTGDDILHGGAGNDRLDGGSDADRLWGGDGSDLLFGAAGDDSLDGGQGNDRLYAGAGSDLLAGGTGIDTAVLDGDRDDYVVDLDDPTQAILRHGSNVAILVGVEYVRFADALVRNGPELDQYV